MQKSYFPLIQSYKMSPTMNELRVEVTTNDLGKMQ